MNLLALKEKDPYPWLDKHLQTLQSDSCLLQKFQATQKHKSLPKRYNKGKKIIIEGPENSVKRAERKGAWEQRGSGEVSRLAVSV